MMPTAASPPREGTSAPSPLAQARARTAELHAAVERRIGLPGPGFGRADCYRLFAALWGFHVPVERLLQEHAALAAILGDLAQRRKEPALRADLLDLDATPAQVEALPLAATPLLDDTATALGWCYVIEGSTLGGEVFSALIAKAAGVSDAFPDRFLRVYGPHLHPRWQAFSAAAGRYLAGADPAVVARFVAGAVDAFTAIDHWFAQRGYHAPDHRPPT